MSKDKPQVEREEEVDVLDEVGQTCSLIVWNYEGVTIVSDHIKLNFQPSASRS
jgi:hypothetical protein